MRNTAEWKPTKFVRTARGLRGSRDRSQVQIGSRIIADTIAQEYDRAIQSYAKGRLLDLGCGHVPLFESYRDRVTDNVCVDWQTSLHRNRFLDVVADLNKQLPFSERSFDTVLLTDVLEHIAEPTHLLADVSKLLRPQGRLIIGVPFFYFLHEEPHDYFRYTAHALKMMCVSAELRVLQVYPYGGLPEILADLTSKGVEFFPGFLPRLLRPAHTLFSSLCRTRLARKYSEWTREKFPLGYIVIAEPYLPRRD